MSMPLPVLMSCRPMTISSVMCISGSISYRKSLNATWERCQFIHTLFFFFFKKKKAAVVEDRHNTFSSGIKIANSRVVDPMFELSSLPILYVPFIEDLKTQMATYQDDLYV